MTTGHADSPTGGPGATHRQRHAVLRRAEWRNTVLWVLYSVPASLGAPLLGSALFPAVLVRLGASNQTIGLLSVVGTLMAPALWLGVIATRRSHHKVRDTLRYGLLSYLPFLLPAAVLLYQGQAVSPALFIAAAFLATVAYNILASVLAVLQSDLLSRATHAARRGRITGFAGLLGGAAGLAGSGALVVLLGRVSFPGNYACAFIAGAVLCGGAFLTYIGVRELPGLKARRVAAPPGFRQSMAALRQDRRFLRFMVPALTATGISSVSVFLAPMALRSGLPDTYVGYFAIAANVAGIVGPPVQGWLADTWGRGRTAMAGAVVAAAGLVGFAHLPFGQWSIAALSVITLGSSAIYGIIYLLVLEVAPSEHRPTYVAVRYGLQGLVSAPLYIGYGWALDHVPLAWAVYAGTACCLVTGLLMLRVGGRTDGPGG